MTDGSVTAEALTANGTSTMLALSTYAQACLAVGATWPQECRERGWWEKQAEDALATVQKLYA